MCSYLESIGSFASVLSLIDHDIAKRIFVSWEWLW